MIILRAVASRLIPSAYSGVQWGRPAGSWPKGSRRILGKKVSAEHPPIAVVVVPKGPEKELHYAIPPSLSKTLKVGLRLQVPLGRRSAVAYLVGFADRAQTPAALREIEAALEEIPLLPPGLIRLAHWISGYYQAPLARTIRLFIPASLESATPRKQIVIRLTRPRQTAWDPSGLGKNARRLKALLEELIRRGGEAPLRDLEASSRTAVAALLRRGIVERIAKDSFRDPFPEIHPQQHPGPLLTPAQQEAAGQIEAAIAKGGFAPFLLHGVTASGKTEIYLRAVEETLRKGKGAIVLVPEIGLTPQLLSRFRSRFGAQVVLFHSGLSAGERLDAWRRVGEGRAQVAVGTRSAAFAPFGSLGLVVVDEEHDPSYKQEEGVRYHARDVCLVRAQQEGATVVLGSATPSLESYWNGLQGKYRHLSLRERVDSRPLPQVEVVPLTRQQPGSLLSSPLLEAIRGKLASGEQTLLFLNQRGFAPFLLCSECGDVPACPHCAVSMTFHKRKAVILCHYCGFSAPPPAGCVRCRGVRLREMGVGTERIEESLKALFPEARLLRMDRDTTQRKHSHHEILRSVSQGEVDILIGTQMIAKGHDLHRVTLVGILCADLGLRLPDFRAMERTFQLLVQVAGRAGRGENPGRVMIQTYNPDHYVIRYAETHDVIGFYREELKFREQAPYPPFCRLTAIRLRGRDEGEVSRAAAQLADDIKMHLSRARGAQLLGPSTCPIERIRGEFRWQILLRGPSNRSLAHLVQRALSSHRRSASVKIEVDVDPQHLL